MKNILCAGVVLTLLLPQIGQAQKAREGVLAAETDFSSLVAEQGSQAALLAHGTPASLVVDKSAYVPGQEFWKKRKREAGSQLVRTAELADVAQSGELGYTMGPWVLSRNGTAQATGEYLTVWRKQADDQWKVAVETSVERPKAAAVGAGSGMGRPQLHVGGATPVAVPPGAVLALDQKFVQAELKDPRGAYLDYLSTEARLYRTGQLPLVGKQAHVAQKGLTHAYVFTPQGGYLAASGDLGYVYGTMRHPSSASRQPDETGTYLRVWRREAVAGWRIVAEVINTETPEAALATTPDPATLPTGQLPARP